ncbi:MAG: TonB-dependent receptor [Xanthomonadales bacterium]|nr:TonB-dependent receptor [Xanthomonadales bacterium]
MIKRHSSTVFNMAATMLLVLPGGQALAEDILELEELVVTAGLQPVSLRDVASSVTVITREEIEQKQVKYLSDLLRDVPGFAVSQAGGAGSQTQIRVRGAEANQLLVLMDGVRANDPAASGEFQYQFALAANIERIEIIRGPQSATWGSDAMAGVINIIRRRDVDERYLSGTVEAGSFDSVNMAVDGGYSGERFRLSGGLSYLDTDGTNISRTGNEKDGAENTTGNLGLEFDISESVNLRLSGQAVKATSEWDEIDYFVTGLPTDADRVTKSDQNFLSGELSYKPLQGRWSGSFSLHRMDSDNENFADGLWSGSTAATTLEYRLRGNAFIGDDRNHRFGFAIEHEDVDFSQRGEASPFGDPNQDQSYDINGYALEYIGKPFTGFSWTLSARLDDYSDFDNAKTWQLAGSYELTQNLRLRGSIGTGSKAPTFTERYGYYEDLFIGNPDLQLESSQGWEIGLESRWGDGQHQLQLAWFDQDLQDEIDGFVFDPVSSLFTAINRETDSHREGLETTLFTRLNQSFGLSASYTYTDATTTDSLGQPAREARRPRHMASLAANYYFKDDRGNLNLNLNYTGSQKDVFYSPVSYSSELVNISAYTVVDLAASWQLTPSLELTGRISNLLDEEYEEVLGFVRPGRAVYGGLRGRFDF